MIKKLGECCSIRTGLVLSRKEATTSEDSHDYRVLSLRNVTENGDILVDEVEIYYAGEQLKDDYFTHVGDILLRLSVPYTAVLVTKQETELLVPSHFAIIRTSSAIVPEYLHWWLAKHRKRFYKIASGGTVMGTISSGFIAEMQIELPPLEKQRKISDLLRLANREQWLLSQLSEKKKILNNAILNELLNKEKS